MLRLQDLNAANARLCLEIAKLCPGLGIKKGQRLVLAVSGGPDSMALALIMTVLAPRLGVEIVACHIDHCLRPGSAQEAAYVRDFCSRIDAQCVLRREDVGLRARLGHCGLEEAGRNARREILGQVRQEVGAAYILTGHQRADLAEDILLRMLRGTGWPGLAGMAWKNGFFLRPLLRQDPQELKAFVASCGFQWLTDPSNTDLSFKRNRVRHLILPVLSCENPALEVAFSHLHDLGTLDADYWNGILNDALARHPWQHHARSIILPKALLQSLHPAGRLRLYHRSLGRLRAACQLSGQARFDTLWKLDQAWQAGIGGKLFQFGAISALVARGEIIFRVGP